MAFGNNLLKKGCLLYNFMVLRIWLRIVNTKLYKLFLAGNIRKSAMTRLHIGCGGCIQKGWLNIGLGSAVIYGRLRRLRGKYYLNYDVSKGLPVRSNSIKEIYASHFIEHLTFNEAGFFLKECYRVLIPGGIIRLTFPDLKLWIDKYYQKDSVFFQDFYSIFPSFANLKTKGDILAGQMYGWGHKWMFDFESLSRLYLNAGFKNVKEMQFRDSNISDIHVLEPDYKGRLLETNYSESMK